MKTTKETKHTATPWGYDLGHTIAQINGDEWGESICQLPSGTHDRAPTVRECADMELIVQAVNHHVELVEALSALIDAAMDNGATVNDGCIIRARAVLAKLAP